MQAGTAVSGVSCPIVKKLHAIATRACKCAIKAHDPLDPREAMALIEDLKACKDSFCCPHGRPAIMRLGRDELARKFKRSADRAPRGFPAVTIADPCASRAT